MRVQELSKPQLILRQMARAFAALWELPVVRADAAIGDAVASLAEAPDRSMLAIKVEPETQDGIEGPFSSVSSFVRTWILYREVSATFSNLTRVAINGVYTDAFFRGSKDRCVRAVMPNTLTDFARETRERGHARTIVDGPVPVSDEDHDAESEKVPPRSISRFEYIEEVKELMQGSRGRELPGTYNPLIVAELFSKRSMP